MTPAQIVALADIVHEIEESRERQKQETQFQRDVMARAKKLQLDTKAVRKVIQRRAEDPDEREAFEGVIFEYENALDKGLRKAREAVEAGATVKAAADAAGVARSNLRRSLGGGGKKDFTTPHDAETGEIFPSAAAPELPGERGTAPTNAPAPAAEPSVTESAEVAAPISASAATTPVAAASAEPDSFLQKWTKVINSPPDEPVGDEGSQQEPPGSAVDRTSGAEPQSTFPSEGKVPESTAGALFRKDEEAAPEALAEREPVAELTARCTPAVEPAIPTALLDGVEVPLATALETPGQLLLRKLMAERPEAQNQFEKASPEVRALVEQTAGLVAVGEIDTAAAVVAIAKASRNRPARDKNFSFSQEAPDDGMAPPEWMRKARH